MASKGLSFQASGCAAAARASEILGVVSEFHRTYHESEAWLLYYWAASGPSVTLLSLRNNKPRNPWFLLRSYEFRTPECWGV